MPKNQISTDAQTWTTYIHGTKVPKSLYGVRMHWTLCTSIHHCRSRDCVEKYKECSKLAHKTIQNRVVSNLIFGGYLYCLGDLLNRISHPRRFILSHSSEYLTRSAFYSSDVFVLRFLRCILYF